LIWTDLLADYISTFFKKSLCFWCDSLNIQRIEAGVADHPNAGLAAIRRHPLQGLARHLQQGRAEEHGNPVVADSCYSGTLARSVKVSIPSSEYFRRIVNKRARVVLTSGGLEPVLDDGSYGHSVFAKAFLDELEKNQGVLEGTRLFNELRRSVILNAPQTPEYSDILYTGHEGGDFLFVRHHSEQ
jgi:hypothetical protein